MRLDGDIAGFGSGLERYRQVYHKSLRVGKARMKPAGDTRTRVERGKFRFRSGPFQEQAPRPWHKLGLQKLKKPVKRCQRSCRDNIGTDRWQGFDALVMNNCLDSGLANDGLQEHCLFMIRLDEVQFGIAQRREDEPRKARAAADIENPGCPSGHKKRKLG